MSPSLDLDTFMRLKSYLSNALSQELQNNPPGGNPAQAGRQALEAICARAKINLEAALREQLFQQILADQLGYGAIQPLLEDQTISEIMVNGTNPIYIERYGQLIETEARFESDQQVLRVIDRILHPLGRRADSDHPMADARLPDGSRVNVIIPPAAVDGPCITIRKFLLNRMTMEDLVRAGALTENMAEFLQACVVARLNILISGPTSSGKTTFLNVLTGYIPGNQRIVTIEDAVELQLKQKHVVRLETRNANMDGSGEVSTRDLVRNALRMRPDRILVGEVRAGETMDMIQAMNTGHHGSITTVHANSPRDAIARLETMAMMAGLEMPPVGDPPPDRLSDQPGDPHHAPDRRRAARDPDHRDLWHGGGCRHHVRYIQVRSDRHWPGWQNPGQSPPHRLAPHVHPAPGGGWL